MIRTQFNYIGSLPAHILIATLLLAFVAVNNAFSAAPGDDRPELVAPVTAKTINAKIDEVKANTSLDDPTKTKLTEIYRKILSNLEAMASNKEAAEAYQQARKSAPKRTQQLRKELEQLQNAPPDSSFILSDQAPLTELDQQLFKEKANLAAVEAKLADIEQKLDDELERPSAARKQLNEAKQRQEEIKSELQLDVAADSVSTLDEAKRWLLETRDQTLSTEIWMLDQELLSQPMRVDLLEAGRDLNVPKVEHIRARVATLEEALGQKRRSEAEQSVADAEQAKREASGKHPLVQKLAQENTEWSQSLTVLADDLERVLGEDEIASQEAKRLADDYRSAQQKLELARLSRGLGQVLREQRRALPDLSSFEKATRVTEQEIADATLVQIRLNDERRKLRDIDGYIAAYTVGLAAEEASQIYDELRTLVINRKELVEKGVTANDAYLRTLGELEFERSQLLETAQTYDGFLAEQLLWIRSSPPVSLATLSSIPENLAWFFSPRHWMEVISGLRQQATSSPVLILAFVILGILLWKSKNIRAELRETGKSVGKVKVDEFTSTTRALVLTLVLAAPLPLFLFALGWQLGSIAAPSAFTEAVATALIKVASALFSVLAFYQLCQPGGLAVAHLRWPKTGVQRLRRALLPLIIVGTPLGFASAVFFSTDISNASEAPGRLALLGLLVLLAVFHFQMFDPKKGALEPFIARHPRSVIGRMPYFWLITALLIPISLIVLALWGYMLTAAQLTQSLFATLWLIFGLVVIHQLAVRWLLLTRLRLTYKAALEKRAAKEAEEAGESEAKIVSDEILDQVTEPEVDLVALNEESRELLTVGLIILGISGAWLIWSDVLPAFGALEQFSLWNRNTMVDGEEVTLPVTLADLIIAVLIIGLTMFAAKRIPAFLEITLLQRLDISPGARYAANTLSKYTIVAVGAILTFNYAGVDTSKLHWLIAALGVGIGFGLQEIVANFISGLIILFERPIRVGDVVTVGETSGVVSRIRIRATTIVNWDKQELLVPNKEFITGRLLNWSLSDQTTRVVIPVGIAYGSDVQKAMALMAEAAEQNELVLEDPAPFVRFEGFGDNALALNLRAYVGALDHRLATVSALHEAINEKFNQAGIVISFPQRDIHLDTSRPLDIRIHRGDREKGIKG